MDYRDERDALRARVESLEGALASAQAEVERMRATEAALEASRREVHLLRAEMARFRPAQPPQQDGGNGGSRMLTILVVSAFAIGVLYLMFGRAASHPPPTVQEPPAVATPVVPAPPPPPVEPPKPAEPPPPPEPAKAARTAEVEWKATIARSQGGAPPPGTACKIVGSLSGDGAEARVQGLQVSCGATFLYRSTDRFNGMSNSSRDVAEIAGKTPGTLQYALSYGDQGPRSGRSQIAIDTSQHQGSVWSDNVPTFRVELRLEPLSVPRTGEPLIDPENRKERLAETVVRTGTVTKLEGTPGVAAGAVCSVEVSPNAGNHNCRIRVRCGGKLFYGDGESGFNQCELKEGRIGRLLDERPSSQDTDPTLDMDLAENTVIVADDAPQAWKLTIGLARAPR